MKPATHKHPELSATQNCACMNLRKVARAVTQHFMGMMASTGLTQSQFSVLSILAQSGPLIMKELSEALIMDRTTLTRTLRPLQHKDLVKSVPGKDTRTREVHITDVGQDILRKALPYWNTAQQSLLDEFGHDQWQSLQIQLDQLTNISRGKTSS